MDGDAGVIVPARLGRSGRRSALVSIGDTTDEFHDMWLGSFCIALNCITSYSLTIGGCGDTLSARGVGRGWKAGIGTKAKGSERYGRLFGNGGLHGFKLRVEAKKSMA